MVTTKDTDNSGKELGASTSEPVPIPLEQLIAEIDSEVGHSDGSGSLASEIEGPAAETGRPSKGQYIRFFLEDILLAIPLSSALEIGHWPDITPLPNLPDWVLGVSNIRGEIISMVDLKAFFGIPGHKLKRNRRFIIASNKEMKVGFIVDRITGIFYLDRSDTEIQTNPYDHGEISSYISGVVATEEMLLNILDIDKLLTTPRMNAFKTD